MKILELVVKNVEKRIEKRLEKFAVYKYRDPETETWYTIKFVKGCRAPQTIEIDANIYRVYIGLTEADKFDFTQKPWYGNNGEVGGIEEVIFVESYTAVDRKTEDELIAAERERIEGYRAQKAAERAKFVSSTAPRKPYRED